MSRRRKTEAKKTKVKYRLRAVSQSLAVKSDWNEREKKNGRNKREVSARAAMKKLV